ncbi:aspartate-semialdehyde dehydrogenase [Pseudomonas daroniae]|uniref:Aspartate-semialdehyde dehydrogenase n=1 Tax=Phytopseudomonas daroniae TaxID=2487519 RepID=A0A4Q9QTE4_9GAMM|nr:MULTISPECIES: aspartate-semialdehyde dehydrogenase [Pseudomonas]TBU83354.1 aspartate-semialdehyde dehydrogenase [Pseudomonas daroniae]TBU84993.1 aspartate-semialdehyde dehydrogenase [Pseudomonas sp. FRB 228]TBU93714.1 aspartate-semialdehyde dehydrogenase [Pseudomonas daroniae]
MTSTFDIAIVGATGSVGEALLQILEDRDFPVGDLHLLASSESAGRTLAYKGRNLRVRAVEGFDFRAVKLAFFAADQSVTLAHADAVRKAGCSLIDLSGALPGEQAPRVVPEVNAGALEGLEAPFALTSPSSIAVAVALVLAALRQQVQVRRLVIDAGLAVSSRGREGVTELARQTAELLNGRSFEPRLFDRQMAFNVLAQIDEPDAQGHGRLERRVNEDIKALFNDASLNVAVSCHQVPVFFGDSLNVTVQASSPVELEPVLAALDAAAGIELVDAGDYPTVIGDAVGQDEVYVGRVRRGLDDPSELTLWIVSDNVRKGAALNAVQLGELLIKHHL